MSANTTIEWTDATWNPVTGCTKVSDGCKHCYAERDWGRLANNPKTPHYLGRKFTDVRTRPEVLEQPLRWKRQRRIFVNSMSDLFHEAVPFEFIDQVFSIMALASQHTFQVLTKRPARMLEWFSRNPGDVRGAVSHFRNDARSWPLSNVWLGVTAENQQTADERIPLLLQAPATVRFVSCEPLLGNIDLLPMFEHRADALNDTGLDWVIAGGESGPKARPMHPDWVRSLRNECATARVPFLFKQWGEWAPNCLCDAKAACRDTSRPEPGKPGVMFRCGKKAAGRRLDDREHLEFPEEHP